MLRGRKQSSVGKGYCNQIAHVSALESDSIAADEGQGANAALEDLDGASVTDSDEETDFAADSEAEAEEVDSDGSGAENAGSSCLECMGSENTCHQRLWMGFQKLQSHVE